MPVSRSLRDTRGELGVVIRGEVGALSVDMDVLLLLLLAKRLCPSRLMHRGEQTAPSLIGGALAWSWSRQGAGNEPCLPLPSPDK